jgi:predicted N-acetyltransferase YhbS
MLPSFAFGFGPRVAMGRRLGELFTMMKSKHPEEPHWYLAVIGSDTSVRGKGYGQALMQSRLDRVDAEHAPAYLESSKADNIPYYQRFGFEVTSELVIPGGGPTLWPMWRKPR